MFHEFDVAVVQVSHALECQVVVIIFYCLHEDLA